MASNNKKRKLSAEKRLFHDEWLLHYFVTPNTILQGSGSICLICKESISVNKEYNVKRHYESRHAEYNTKYPVKSTERQKRVDFLKSELTRQQTIFSKAQTVQKKAYVASLKVAWTLCKHKKPFSDVDVVKECFSEVTSTLFSDDKKMQDRVRAEFNAVSLSRRCITRRADEINVDIEDQLKEDITRCQFYSLCLDESCDITDIAQLAVFIRMVFSDGCTKDEFLSLEPLLSTTRGQDVYHALISVLNRFDIPPEKLVSVATDGAPSMMGSHNGLIGLLRADDKFPAFLSYHCVIHQENLCAGKLGFEEVFKEVVKIVNFIRASPLRHRQFREFISDIEDKNFDDLTYHNNVRWLSRGNVLKRFFNLKTEILAFLHDNKREHEVLCDHSWLTKLAFLTDITKHLNDLNLKLQGQMKCLSDMILTIDAFKSKLTLFKTHLSAMNWTHFPCLGEVMQAERTYPEQCDFVAEVDNLLQEFQLRFRECNAMKVHFHFFRNPFTFDPNDFTDSIVNDVSKAQLEILEIQSDDELARSHAKVNPAEFWQTVNQNSYPTLKTAANKLLCMVGSTYCCEQLFSQMNVVKNKLRNRLTQDHLICQLRTSINSYSPRYDNIQYIAD